VTTKKPRMYGQHSDKPEDPKLCIEAVSAHWAVYQCSRKRGHGLDGLYCKQHAAVIQKRIDDAEKWNREMKAQREERKLEKELGKLLQGDAVFLYAMENMATELYNYKFQRKEVTPDADAWCRELVEFELDYAKKARIKP